MKKYCVTISVPDDLKTATVVKMITEAVEDIPAIDIVEVRPIGQKYEQDSRKRNIGRGILAAINDVLG